MKYFLMTTLLFFSHSSMAFADVGCGPSPKPNIPDDTAVEDTGEENNEEAKKSINRMDIALLFLPVIGLVAFSRREE